MTEKQRSAVNGLYSRDYRDRKDGYGDGRLLIHWRRADNITDPSEVLRRYKDSEAIIADIEELLEQFKAYTVALGERYNFLIDSPSFPVVKLERKKHYYEKKVLYRLTTCRRYEDGTEYDCKYTIYSGTQRREAIKAYNDYLRNHPGIIAEMDIERKHWEK